MVSSIFDPAVVAKPCRAGCHLHVHVDWLPSQSDALEPEQYIPAGWTAQTPAHVGEVLFLCNLCGAEVWESETATHVCAMR